jgi:hypothetical protein
LSSGRGPLNKLTVNASARTAALCGLILVTVLTWPDASHANRRGPASCPIPPSQRPDVPECPPDGTMLPETYPAAAVVLSDDILGGDDRLAARMGIDRHRVIGDKAISILRASGQHPPVMFLNMDPASVRVIEQRIRREAPDRATQARWLAALRRTGAQTFNWQQDIMQPFFDPRTGRPVIRGVDRYVNQGFNADATLAAISAAAAQCGVTTGPTMRREGSLENGHGGGNIEAYPGGNCVLGTNHLESGQWSQYSTEACGGQRPLQIDTSFLGVGHTDEIFSVVPSNQSRCGFAVMVASPRLGVGAVGAKSFAGDVQLAARCGARAAARTHRELRCLARRLSSLARDACRAARAPWRLKGDSHTKFSLDLVTS